MAVFVLDGKPAVKCDRCKRTLIVDEMPATGWYIGEFDMAGDLCPKHYKKERRVNEEI